MKSQIQGLQLQLRKVELLYFVSRPKIDLSRKPVAQWDKSNIKQWFQENKISIDLCKLYQFEDGTQLLTYAASLSNNEKIELQRQIYSDEFDYSHFLT